MAVVFWTQYQKIADLIFIVPNPNEPEEYFVLRIGRGNIERMFAPAEIHKNGICWQLGNVLSINI